MQQTKDLLRNLKSLTGPFPDFHTKDLPDYPSDLFVEWLYVAIEKGIHEPHAMTLSTVDKAGAPDARVLILKDVINNGWYFATSTTSRKGEQLKFNPKVALTFYWAEIGRQVRIRGVATEMPPETNSNDFLERSSGARALALIGHQSKELMQRENLDEALLKTKELVKEAPDTVSSTWKLYVVYADEVEFWQGDPERKHRRVQYQRKDDHWIHRLLWP
ncbi:pyridoxine/pyridoxamine 5'-phosphate oxidase [Gracilibacillus thailandensis]|uniref:Pyridoxamine 5'-phosphate oxidase n=1 Tax=Gracilibacillus thailandensis TaxID=563735 RepID=A0A6N7QWG0_9BACI|nr:pyridoxal 5'-phosphate synthase [Gracilibacillus thailandensis]MRI65864.1 pyridoxamine 5'-phosphate oxidase [Gracilibacillus thailandensis]